MTFPAASSFDGAAGFAWITRTGSSDDASSLTVATLSSTLKSSFFDDFLKPRLLARDPKKEDAFDFDFAGDSLGALSSAGTKDSEMSILAVIAPISVKLSSRVSSSSSLTKLSSSRISSASKMGVMVEEYRPSAP